MIDPELFDVIELLGDLAEYNLRSGTQGAIVECFNDGKYEIEFTDRDGETVALCTLSPDRFIVVWQAKTKSWLSLSDRLAVVVSRLSEERKREVLDFARSVYQKRV